MRPTFDYESYEASQGQEARVAVREIIHFGSAKPIFLSFTVAVEKFSDFAESIIWNSKLGLHYFWTSKLGLHHFWNGGKQIKWDRKTVNFGIYLDIIFLASRLRFRSEKKMAGQYIFVREIRSLTIFVLLDV